MSLRRRVARGDVGNSAKIDYSAFSKRGSGMNAVKKSSFGRLSGLAILPGLTALAGCINVAAPDKPIVIELNINIKQEVVYRLDGAAKNLIEEQAEIF